MTPRVTARIEEAQDGLAFARAWKARNKPMFDRMFGPDKRAVSASEIGIARVYLGQALRDLRAGETPDAITMIEGALVRLGGKL